MERVQFIKARIGLLGGNIILTKILILFLLLLSFYSSQSCAGALLDDKLNASTLIKSHLNYNYFCNGDCKEALFNDTITVPTLDIQLYKNNNTNLVATDSVRLNFEDFYNNGIDANDVIKTNYSQTNLAILKSNVELSVERRTKLLVTDTIFLKLSNISTGAFRIVIDPSVLDYPFLQPFIRDNYLQTETTISFNNIATVDFNVIDVASTANRFYIFFRPKVVAGSLPVTFISMQAARGENKANIIRWKVAIELNLKHYETETSTNGISFTKFGTNVFGTSNGNAASYEQRDVNPTGMVTYYRIKAISTTGQFVYSNIAKVKAATNFVPIQVTPNPVANKQVRLIFNDRRGIYNYAITNLQGKIISTGKINVGRNREEKNIALFATTAFGRYEMILVNEFGERTNITMMVL